MSSSKYWLGFNLAKGIGSVTQQALLNEFGSARAAWLAPEGSLARCGLSRSQIRSLAEARDSLDLDREYEKLAAAGASVMCWGDDLYPRYLREIPSSPPLMYFKGEVLPADAAAVAVVGTRRVSSYGRQVTRQIVTGLVAHGITVVSGLARGVDSIAHKVALDLGGRTIAVLGSGLDIIYPSENRALAHNITEGHGALVTEYRLGTKPDGRNFPARNRIISGLSQGVIVIEAGQRSGALITSRFALEQDREVFAVPGNINSPLSKGTNRLIQQGAKLVSSVQDVIEEFAPDRAIPVPLPGIALVQNPLEAKLLSYLSEQPLHVDTLGKAAGVQIGDVTSALMEMELRKIVENVGGMNYVRV